MARMATKGLDEVIIQMTAMGEDMGHLADEMLEAGGEVIKEAWKETIRNYKLHENRLVDEGEMFESVDWAREPIRISQIKTVAIYPRGKDKKGVKNAEKAFISHYGSSRIRGLNWVDEAEELAGPRVEAKVLEIYDDWLMSKEI